MSGSPSDTYAAGLFRTASAGNLARSVARRRKALVPRPTRPKPKPRLRKPKQVKVKDTPKRAVVAALLACGLEMDVIAGRMGITLKAVHRHFEDIRRALGEQAR